MIPIDKLATTDSAPSIWNPEMECLPTDQLHDLQLDRLRATLARVDERLPFYHQRFEAAGIQPDYIHSLEDVRRLPFLMNDDLRDNFPYGLFASPMRDVVRLHASSGTTGRPTVVGYTRRDLDTWA